MSKTNMERIKNTSYNLLDLEITKTSYWPDVAQHPITNSGFYHWRDEN